MPPLGHLGSPAVKGGFAELRIFVYQAQPTFFTSTGGLDVLGNGVRDETYPYVVLIKVGSGPTSPGTPDTRTASTFVLSSLRGGIARGAVSTVLGYSLGGPSYESVHSSCSLLTINVGVTVNRSARFFGIQVLFSLTAFYLPIFSVQGLRLVQGKLHDRLLTFFGRTGRFRAL